MNGWIKLHRKLMDHPHYLRKPFCEMMAWVDMLLLANHDDDFFMVRGRRVDVKRGQIGLSEESLAKRWQWSRGKVRRYLESLHSAQQVVQQKNNLTSIISIVNYDQYQETGQQPVQHSVHKQEVRSKKSLNTKGKKSGKKGNTAPGPARNLIVPLGFDDRFQDLWRAYREYRVAERKGWYKDGRTEQTALNDFWNISGGDYETAKAIVNKTIASRWTGLFPVKKQTHEHSGNSQNGKSAAGKVTATLHGIGEITDF